MVLCTFFITKTSKSPLPVEEQPKIVKKAVISRKRDEIPKERAKFLLEFIYGLHGTPKRLGLANYVLPTAEKSEEKPSLPKNLDSFSQISTTEKSHALSTSKFFDVWLQNYEHQKSKASQRQASASRQASLITKAKLSRWTDTILRKSVNTKPASVQAAKLRHASPLLFRNEVATVSRPSISDGKRPGNKEKERFVKSAYISAKLDESNVLRRRPKTVSFIDNPNKDNVNIQPTYLVSQIEMEDILRESAKRIKFGMNEKLHTGYFKHLEKNNELLRQKNSSIVSFADIVEIETDSDGEEYFRKFSAHSAQRQVSARYHQSLRKPSSSLSVFQNNVKSASSSSGYKSKTKSYSDFYDDSVISTAHRYYYFLAKKI